MSASNDGGDGDLPIKLTSSGKGSAMNSYILSRRIEALLDDPLVSLMMQADGVDRACLARQLLDLGRSVERRSIRGEKPRRAMFRWVWPWRPTQGIPARERRGPTSIWLE
jgi:hypothetical protein